MKTWNYVFRKTVLVCWNFFGSILCNQIQIRFKFFSIKNCFLILFLIICYQFVVRMNDTCFLSRENIKFWLRCLFSFCNIISKPIFFCSFYWLLCFRLIETSIFSVFLQITRAFTLGIFHSSDITFRIIVSIIDTLFFSFWFWSGELGWLEVRPDSHNIKRLLGPIWESLIGLKPQTVARRAKETTTRRCIDSQDFAFFFNETVDLLTVRSSSHRTYR